MVTKYICDVCSNEITYSDKVEGEFVKSNFVCYESFKDMQSRSFKFMLCNNCHKTLCNWMYEKIK